MPLFRKSRFLIKSTLVTSASLYSLTYLYNNNYLFSHPYTNSNNNTAGNHQQLLQLRNGEAPEIDSTHPDYFLNPSQIPLSKWETHLVRPLVAFSEGAVRFSRTMFYMGRIAQRYFILERLHPTISERKGNHDSMRHLESEEITRIQQKSDAKWQEAHQKGAHEILQLCQNNGGIYIKFGQYLATMQNIIPEIYCDVLEVLKDKAPPTSFHNVEKLFYEDFGRRIQDEFTEFDPEPIAAASVAQVHRAKTNDGREVAVKVQYPAVRRSFHIDTFTMDVVIHGAALLFPGWNMKDLAPEMKKDLYRELDFVHEKENARRAARFFAHRKDVHIPVVYDDLSSTRILTTEFIHGCKITEVDKLQEMGISVKKAAQIMLEAFAEQIYIHGHLHADPHASNHFLRRDPDTGCIQLVILDHGLYQELTEDFRRNFCRLWKALVVHDNDFVKQYCDQLGIEDYELFSAIMLMRTYDHSVAFSSKVKKADFDDIKDLMRFQMDRMMDILSKIPRQMLLILRNLNILRALNHSLGAPVNRFRINALVASQGIDESASETASFLQRLRMWRERFRFQLWIFRQTVAASLFDMWLRIGVFLRLLPPLPEMDDEMILAA